jgi:hypothetical protein
VVLVAGTIPGERVTARVERVAKSVAHADTVEVITASPDRRPAPDWRCGGRDYAHVAYDRQRALKAEIIADAFRRLARLPLASLPAVMASPEEGYRMRARLHAKEGRSGSSARDPTRSATRVAPAVVRGTVAWIRRAEHSLPTPRRPRSRRRDRREHSRERTDATSIVRGAVDRAAWGPLAEGLTGLTVAGRRTS